MKGKLIIIFLYILLALIVGTTCVYWLFSFTFDDILNYYHRGILKYIFILIMVAVIVLPIIKYRRHKQKWILPLVLCLMIPITSVFNNGILKFVEDDLRIYSKEKWEEHKNLRIYMLDDLETHYMFKGQKEEHVKSLLGEPDLVSWGNSQQFEYLVSPGYIDPVMFYIQFENGVVVETGKRHT